MEMDSIGLASGRAGSADDHILFQSCPRNRIVEIRGTSFPTDTVFSAVWLPVTTFTRYLPGWEPDSRQTIVFSAGMCTGEAVCVISGGRSSDTSFKPSLPLM